MRRFIALALALVFGWEALALGPAYAGASNPPVILPLSHAQGGNGAAGTNPATTSANTAVATGAAGVFLPFGSTVGLVPGELVSGSNVPAGDTIASVDGGSSPTTQAAPLATAAGLYLIPVANSAGILPGQLAVDTTTAAGLSSQTAVMAVNGTATAAISLTATTGGLSGSVYIPVTGTAARTCTPGMLVYDLTTSGVVPAGDTISQINNTNQIRLAIPTTAAPVSGDSIKCYDAISLSNAVPSGGIAAGDTLTFYPAVTLAAATTAAVASATPVTFTANPATVAGSGAYSPDTSAVAGNLNVGGTLSTAALTVNGIPYNNAVPPCQLLAGGCLTALSVDQQLSAAYLGPIVTLYKNANGTLSTQSFYKNYNSLTINTVAEHQFCDGWDCWYQEVWDQGIYAGTAQANNVPQFNPANMCRLIWMANGLPGGACSGTDNQFMLLQNTHNLPTTGSRTIYETSDNFYPTDVNLQWAWGGTNVLSGAGGSFGFIVGQSSTISPNSPFFGVFLDYGYDAWGAYPPGFTQFAALAKYNAADNTMYAGMLPASTCFPIGTSSAPNAAPTGACNIFPTFNGTPPATINTGYGNTPVFWIGMGTDGGNYGARFQNIIIANYATTPAEDSAVMASLALTNLPPKPTSCAAVPAQLGATWSATAPGSSSHNTPQSYTGTTVPNLASLVKMDALVLLNPYWNGPLVRLRRPDTGAQADIYSNGCGFDTAAATTFCSGVTCTISQLFDVSGHGWDDRQPTPANQAALNLTGVGGKPGACFTRTAPDYYTTSRDLWDTFGGSTNWSYAYGLNQGMTIEAIFQQSSNSNPLGVIEMLPYNGWYFDNNSSGEPDYHVNTEGSLISFGSAPALNLPHFAYVTADATPGTGLSASQNLAMNMDNSGSPVTNTASVTAVEQAGQGTGHATGAYVGSGGSVSSGYAGCLGAVMLYNDVESSANLLAAQQNAQNNFGAP